MRAITGSLESSTWPWSTWPACQASFTRFLEWERSSCSRAWANPCWNMGASRWQTIRTIVLPNSISGILTGVILQVSRAAGETAAILFTGAAFYLPYLPHSVRDQCMALSMHLFTISTQVPNVPKAMPYATALVLLGVVLV